MRDNFYAQPLKSYFPSNISVDVEGGIEFEDYVEKLMINLEMLKEK